MLEEYLALYSSPDIFMMKKYMQMTSRVHVEYIRGEREKIHTTF
jgi:hypothetical protein